ncbi:MAG: nicotinate (nicotinamide) nucleotide adenylyltransferase [Oscillospiraceae bacterium]|nr:nicotinate (nicotinamide) nucleotide adenylyltransferase [Oscillospiraceae bacterium]
MTVTAIFGGTFNPFHIGHYEMLSAINNLDFVDKILLMPDKIPPHKSCPFLADDKDRIEMCRLAAEDFSKAELCLTEFEREGKSYTFDTVLRLKEIYKDTKLSFVCGADMITSFKTWYRWEELAEMVDLLAFSRKGVQGFNEAVEDLRKSGANITVIPDVITEVSSTELRDAISSKKAEKLIPHKIYSYIKEKGIYDA